LTGVVTIAEVARHAGVAPSTVSYVLTGKRSISADTTSRVRDSIRALGYDRHSTSRTPGRLNVLGLVLPPGTGLSQPVESRFMAATVMHARRHDMDVLLMTGIRRGTGVDGFLVMDASPEDERLALLRHLTRPAVFVGQPVAAKGFTCVDFDFEAAGARCVDHLADLGHRYIGFLGGPSVIYRRTSGFAHRTMAGFSAAAMRRGIATTAVPAEEDRESVSRTITSLLRAHPAMTALVVQNEAAAGWVAGSLRAAGRKLPDDMAIVTICPDSAAARSSSPVATVHLPAEELAGRAVELLAGLINGVAVPPLTLLAPRLSERVGT
jgi:DNA-binding LacI/PurR family transcriptional regulator